MKLVVRHELIGEECLVSNNSLRNTVVLLSGASKLVRAVAHRRLLKAPSMITKARYALVPNLIAS